MTAAAGAATSSSSASTRAPVQAKALYTFTPQNPNEIFFPKGVIVSITRVVDDNWFEGVFEGKSGLVPRSYVEILVGGGGSGGGGGGGGEGAATDRGEGGEVVVVGKSGVTDNASGATSTVTQFQNVQAQVIFTCSNRFQACA